MFSIKLDLNSYQPPLHLTAYQLVKLGGVVRANKGSTLPRFPRLQKFLKCDHKQTWGEKSTVAVFAFFASHHSITAERENHSRELFVGAADDLGMKLMQALRSENSQNSECSEICWKYESL